MGAGSNSIIFDDLEWPQTRLSKSLYTSKSNISNRCVLWTKLLKITNRKPYTIYLMVPLSMTLSDLWPRFQGNDIFRHWISQKTTRDKAHSYYRTSIRNRMRSIEWWYFQYHARTSTRPSAYDYSLTEKCSLPASHSLAPHTRCQSLAQPHPHASSPQCHLLAHAAPPRSRHGSNW